MDKLQIIERYNQTEDEAYRRAVEGVRRPVFHGGVKVGEITEYSDRLLIQLLRRRRPEGCSPRHESTAHVNATMTLPTILHMLLTSPAAQDVDLSRWKGLSQRAGTLRPVPTSPSSANK